MPADTRPVPLSAAQRRMWAMAQTWPGDTSYNQPFEVRLDGPLDVDALRQAYDALVHRHPPLRSRVAELDGEPHLVPDRWPASGWAVEEAGEEHADEVAARFGQAPIDLAAGPLTRTRLVRTGPTHHRLLVSQHHITSDERSVAVFVDELAAAYGRCAAGRPPSWPGPSPDYPAYWTRRVLAERAELARATRCWSAHLSGLPELVDLPTVQPRPVPGSPRRAHHVQTYGADLAAGLRRLARAHRASPFMVLKAALDVVLGSYGTDQVATGFARYGRDTDDSAGLIGFLAAPAVLRGDLRGDPSFVALLGRTRDAVLDTHELPELPLDLVLDAIGHTRDPSYHPLYQVLFSTTRPAREQESGGVTFRVAFPPLDSVKVDLEVGVTEYETALDAMFSYRADLFAPSTVAEIARRFGAVLAAVADDPHQRVDVLRGLPDPGAVAPPQPGPTPSGGGPLAWFSSTAARVPEAVAVRAGAWLWTYHRLRTAVDGLADALRHRGLGREALVGICVPPRPELVAALLAVPGAGAVAVPIDPARPRHQLRDRIVELGLDVVLVDHVTEALLDGVGTPTLRLDLPDGFPVDAPARPAGAGPAPDEAAWAVTSAGTAGPPRVVVLTHHDLEDRAGWLSRAWPAGTFARVPVTGPVDRMWAAWSVLAPLANGGCVLLDDTAGATVRLGPHTPTGPEPPVTIGACWPGDATWAVWAASEVGGPVTAGTDGTLGLARDGVTLHVLDERLRPVAPGAVGRLYVGGAGVTRGYLGRPGATAASFVADPFGAAGARMVATDDLVRRYASGELSRVGRATECGRRRGIVVSPAPARAALSARPGVARAGVVMADDGRLVAGVEADPTTAERLRAELTATLPGFLVPDRLVPVPVVPVSPSGAVDRAGLLAAVEHADVPPPGVPSSRVDQEVERAWQAVLGRPAEPGRSFFESGGDSVRLIRLRGLLTTALGCPVDVVELFRHPTARSMAAYLRTLLPEGRAIPGTPTRLRSAADRGADRRRARRSRDQDR